jgi:hypothetical protein
MNTMIFCILLSSSEAYAASIILHDGMTGRNGRTAVALTSVNPLPILTPFPLAILTPGLPAASPSPDA